MVLNKWERVETYASVASLTAAAALFAGGLLFESRPLHRLFLSGSAIALSGTGLVLSNTRGEQARRYNQLAINSQWEKAMILSEHGLEELYKKLHPKAAREWQEQEAELLEELPALEPGTDESLYDWNDLADASSGLIIAGQTGYGKSTSAIAAIIELTKSNPAHVVVYDKHAKRNRWHEFGLNAIHRIEEIEAGILAMGEELKARNGRDENGPPITIVIDELIAAKKQFADWKAVNEVIENLLIEGRKFDMTAILLTQSMNCAAIGLDSAIRANAFWIVLGELATRQFRKNTPEYDFLSQQAYPCCVSGCVTPKPAIHLTHGHHETFKKKNNPPKFNGKINQLTGEPFEFTRRLEGDAESDRSPAASRQKTETFSEEIDLEKRSVETLETLLGNSELPASILTPAEWELLGFANSQGVLSVRDAQRSRVARRENWDADQIKGIFSRFAEMDLGSISFGDKGSVEFKVGGNSDD